MIRAAEWVCHDADSHILGTVDWVTRAADPGVRDNPYPEGTDAPIGKSERTFEALGMEDWTGVYRRNLREMMGLP